MKNKSLILVAILLIIIVVLLLRIKHLTDIGAEKQQQIIASANYIEDLKAKLLDKEDSGSQINKREELKKILKEFIDNDVGSYDEQVILDKIEGIEKRKRFIPDLVPIKSEYKISQRYSERHKGIDFATELGEEVSSAAAGEVVIVKYDKYFGNVIVVDHFNGYISFYAHLASVFTEKEDFVKKGEVIGLVGNTGNSSGPHLHFEILKNDKNIDPETLILD